MEAFIGKSQFLINWGALCNLAHLCKLQLFKAMRLVAHTYAYMHIRGSETQPISETSMSVKQDNADSFMAIKLASCAWYPVSTQDTLG